MNSSGSASAASRWWPPTFRGGIRPAIAFVLAFSLWVMVSNSLIGWLFGPDPSVVLTESWNLPSGIVQVGITVLVLRYEGVRLRDIGLSRRLLVPAIVATGGFLIALNVVVAGLVVLGGNQLSVGLFALYRSPPANYSLAVIAVSGVAQYLFVGPVEELAFRGYLQNKLIALLGSGYARVRTAVGIVATGFVFSLLHVPTLVLIDAFGVEQLVGTLVVLALSGIVFGTIYASTRNLYLVAFLHGIGNFWPLVVDPGLGAWPNWGVLLVLYGLLVVLYRHWTATQ